MSLLQVPPSLASISSVRQVGAQRNAFLPAMFGVRHFVLGEAMVFRSLEDICPSYTGGSWDFFKLSNGGHYLAPESAEPLTLCVHGNGYQGEMSADAAGIVASLFALCALAHQLHESDAGDHAAEQFHALREFALNHIEARSILDAID